MLKLQWKRQSNQEFILFALQVLRLSLQIYNVIVMPAQDSRLNYKVSFQLQQMLSGSCCVSLNSKDKWIPSVGEHVLHMNYCKARANTEMEQDSIPGHSFYLWTVACLFSSRSLKLGWWFRGRCRVIILRFKMRGCLSCTLMVKCCDLIWTRWRSWVWTNLAECVQNGNWNGHIFFYCLELM